MGKKKKGSNAPPPQHAPTATATDTLPLPSRESREDEALQECSGQNHSGSEQEDHEDQAVDGSSEQLEKQKPAADSQSGLHNGSQQELSFVHSSLNPLQDIGIEQSSSGVDKSVTEEERDISTHPNNEQAEFQFESTTNQFQNGNIEINSKKNYGWEDSKYKVEQHDYNSKTPLDTLPTDESIQMTTQSDLGDLDDFLGVKAEPKSLIRASTLATISSLLVSGISSLVDHVVVAASTSTQNGSNIHPSNHTEPGLSKLNDIAGVDLSDMDGEFNNRPKRRHLLWSRFVWVDWTLPELLRVGLTSSKSLCLFHGYKDGFQIWSMSDTQNVHELISITDQSEFSYVTELVAIPISYSMKARESLGESILNHQPLLAVAHRDSPDSVQSDKLSLYSLLSHTSIHSWKYPHDMILHVKSNQTTVAVALASSKIQLMSLSTLSTTLTISDVTPTPTIPPTIPFDLGSRYIAYASSTHPQVHSYDTSTHTSESISQQQQFVKVAGAVAKEIVGGVKIVGGLGYQAISNYFSGAGSAEGSIGLSSSSSGSSAMSNVGSPSNTGALSVSPPVSSLYSSFQRRSVDGVICVRDITTKSLKHHFKAHSSPITHLEFTSSGSRIISSSSAGTTFPVFDMHSRHMTPTNIHTFERGFTAAEIQAVGEWSGGIWVLSRRGTCHLFKWGNVKAFARVRRNEGICVDVIDCGTGKLRLVSFGSDGDAILHFVCEDIDGEGVGKGASVQDIVSWGLVRGEDWEPVKRIIKSQMLNQILLSQKDSRAWASQIEISTYDSVAFGIPPWLGPLLTFQILQDHEPTLSNRPLVRTGDCIPDLSDFPGAKPLQVKRDISKPYGLHLPDSTNTSGDISSKISRKKREGVSFEDADVIDGSPATDQNTNSFSRLTLDLTASDQASSASSHELKGSSSFSLWGSINKK